MKKPFRAVLIDPARGDAIVEAKETTGCWFN